MNKKSKAASLSVFSNITLIILKVITGIMTGSVSIISEAIHSTMDLFAALMAFFSIKIAEKPADHDHPYGHEKVENVSGVVEGLLIVAASAMIISEAVKKITSKEPIESVGLGFVVMFISAFVNFLVSKYLYKVAKEEDSIALEADALHLKADVYTSLGVGIGLMVISITKLTFLDPFIAIIIAIFILKEAWELTKNAFLPLLDSKLSDMEILKIKNVLNTQDEVYCDYHDLRTRRAGKTKHIDLHLTVCSQMTVKQAHDICDSIEGSIEDVLNYSKVLIHTEPCDQHCGTCKIKKDH